VWQVEAWSLLSIMGASEADAKGSTKASYFWTLPVNVFITVGPAYFYVQFKQSRILLLVYSITTVHMSGRYKIIPRSQIDKHQHPTIHTKEEECHIILKYIVWPLQLLNQNYIKSNSNL
jgi:hypothetical protein